MIQIFYILSMETFATPSAGVVGGGGSTGGGGDGNDAAGDAGSRKRNEAILALAETAAELERSRENFSKELEGWPVLQGCQQLMLFSRLSFNISYQWNFFFFLTRMSVQLTHISTNSMDSEVNDHINLQ
uniref:Uncharacterized protein n=1 Tax=Populus trichocarpa TaxID=3694 RepID=A0A2K1Z3E1_POPTR